MFTYLLSWLFGIYMYVPSQIEPLQSKNSIKISGICHDIYSGRDLKIRAFALVKGTKIALGESKEVGIFNKFAIQLPDSVEFLSFESEGYRATTMPVNYIGKVEGNFEFDILVPMSAKDSLPLPTPNQLHWLFASMDNTDINYNLKKLKPFTNRMDFTNKEIRKNHLYFHWIEPGKYVLTASAADGRLLHNEEFNIKPGFTLKAVSLNLPEEPKATTVSLLTFSPKTLYFDQSSYELRNETKASLDSVSIFLMSRQDIAAHITGYTDNVGERKKNLTLSEFRAKMVMNYLTRKGVRADQIIIQWKGSDTWTSTDDSEESKIKKRRAEIQFLPK